MGSSATLSISESKVRPGQPFRVNMSLVLPVTERVRAVVPSISVGGTQQNVSCAIETTGPNSRNWGAVIYAVPKGGEVVKIGARIDLLIYNELTGLWDSDSIEATALDMAVVDEDGLLWFNTHEQSGMKAAVL